MTPDERRLPLERDHAESPVVLTGTGTRFSAGLDLGENFPLFAGVEELASVAGVSKRTLYKLFPGKDQLVAAYLRQVSENLGTSERDLLRGDLAPRERLLALFRRPGASAPFRGCPFHNAAVELADPDHPARPVVLAHKQP